MGREWADRAERRLRKLGKPRCVKVHYDRISIGQRRDAFQNGGPATVMTRISPYEQDVDGSQPISTGVVHDRIVSRLHELSVRTLASVFLQNVREIAHD